MFKLSIVIPTKNEEDYLPRLLQTIQEQSYQPCEVIVSDAGSTDHTREIAERFGCRIVDGGMPGPGRNRGAEAASGDVLLFLDADVELNRRTFLYDTLKEFQDRALDFAACDVVPLSERKIDHWSHEIFNTYCRAVANVHPHASGCCIFAKREKHLEMGGFDETVVFCEDHDYAYRGAKIGSFGVLRSVKVPTSVRRFERDGRLGIAVKYTLAEAHLLTLGPIRSDIFHFTFGHSKKRV